MHSQLLISLKEILLSLQELIDIASGVPVACSIIHFIVSIVVFYLSVKVFTITGKNPDIENILKYTDELSSINGMKNNTRRYLVNYSILTAILVTSIVSMSSRGLNIELVIILSVASGYITCDKISSILYKNIYNSTMEKISSNIYKIKENETDNFKEEIAKFFEKRERE